MSTGFQIGKNKVSVCSDAGTHWDLINDLVKERTDKRIDEPFYVTNLSVVLAQYRKWNLLFPSIQPHYAVKANPDDAIIRLLSSLGCGFDCASKGEMAQVLSQGVPPSQIIFANTIKSPSHIRHAMNCGVDLMTFDNREELYKIKQNGPDARLVLRISAMDQTAISKLSLKFGCEPSHKAPRLMRLAKELDLNIVGISFHVGGGSKNPLVYAEAIQNARKLFDLGKAIGFDDMHLLDIGGGYPGFCSEVISLNKISLVVNQAVSEQFSGWPGLKVISEPGRFFAMPSSVLAVSVIGKAKTATQVIAENPYYDCSGYMYYVNDGVFGSFNCVPVYKIEPPAIAYGKDYSKMYWSRVWGPTCDSADCISEKVLLPELKIGDLLVYEYMGAYTRCIASNFNGMPAPRIYYLATLTDGAFINDLIQRHMPEHSHSKVGLSISLCSSTGDNDSGLSDLESVQSLSPEEEIRKSSLSISPSPSAVQLTKLIESDTSNQD